MKRAANRIRLGALVGVLLVLLGIAAFRWTQAHTPWAQAYQDGVTAADERNFIATEQDEEKAISLDPKRAEAYDELADAQLNLRRPTDALQTLERLAKIDPNHPHVFIRMAEAYVGVNNADLLFSARAAVLDEPRSLRARLLLALGLAQSGDTRDALAELAIAHDIRSAPILTQAIRTCASLQGKPQQFARAVLPMAANAPM